MTSCTFEVPINTRTLRYNYVRQHRREATKGNLRWEPQESSLSNCSCSIRKPRSNSESSRSLSSKPGCEGHHHRQKLCGPKRNGPICSSRIRNNRITGWGHFSHCTKGESKLSSTSTPSTNTLVLTRNGVYNG